MLSHLMSSTSMSELQPTKSGIRNNCGSQQIILIFTEITNVIHTQNIKPFMQQQPLVNHQPSTYKAQGSETIELKQSIFPVTIEKMKI